VFQTESLYGFLHLDMRTHPLYQSNSLTFLHAPTHPYISTDTHTPLCSHACLPCRKLSIDAPSLIPAQSVPPYSFEQAVANSMQCGVAQMGEADAQKSCAARNKAQTPDTDGRLARVGEAAQKGSWAASRAFLVNGPPVKLTVSAAAHCDWGKGGWCMWKGKGRTGVWTDGVSVAVDRASPCQRYLDQHSTKVSQPASRPATGGRSLRSNLRNEGRHEPHHSRHAALLILVEQWYRRDRETTRPVPRSKSNRCASRRSSLRPSLTGHRP